MAEPIPRWLRITSLTVLSVSAGVWAGGKTIGKAQADAETRASTSQDHETRIREVEKSLANVAANAARIEARVEAIVSGVADLKQAVRDLTSEVRRTK